MAKVHKKSTPSLKVYELYAGRRVWRVGAKWAVDVGPACRLSVTPRVHSHDRPLLISQHPGTVGQWRRPPNCPYRNFSHSLESISTTFCSASSAHDNSAIPGERHIAQHIPAPPLTADGPDKIDQERRTPAPIDAALFCLFLFGRSITPSFRSLAFFRLLFPSKSRDLFSTPSPGSDYADIGPQHLNTPFDISLTPFDISLRQLLPASMQL